MASDRDASELVSRSFSGILTSKQSGDLTEAVEQSVPLRNYAKLSGMIQDSVSDIAMRAAAGDDSLAPGLSADAKDRMRRSVSQEQLKRSRSGMGISRTLGLESSTVADNRSTTETGRTMSSEFTFVRKLGEGGLGTVWLARDVKLKRLVAVKEMNADAAEIPRAWARFHREAEITGHLEHPSVVPLYQFGTDSRTGQPFYAMRFVGKRTLVNAILEYHERLNAGKDVSMDLHNLLTAFISVCQAIAYAHSRGVIHRDLKPENVAIDNFGQVIVLDWGLAKTSTESEMGAFGGISGMASDPDFGKTVAGEVIGTPLYMAPEQAAGNLDNIDERTDVYGLGAILFSMLTGSAPHQASSIRDGQPVRIHELLKSISENPSPSPRSYRPNIPSGLEAICLRAMERHSHSRYASAMDLAEDVQKWMAGRSQRREQYDNARSEGRELRTSLQSSVRDLERNVRFMASIPPIQEIVDGVRKHTNVELPAWRERLSLIFQGLLRANCDFSSVSFCEVADGQWRELVRVERHSTDYSSVRAIPGSRLASGPLTSCMQTALDLNPEEVHLALSADCGTKSTGTPGKSKPSMLSAGVPVYDSRTEELFGFVRIEASLDRLIESEMRDRLKSTADLVVLDNDCSIILHMNRTAGRIRQSEGRPMTEFLSDWPEVRSALKNSGEFYDEHNHAIHATRVDLIPGRYSLAIVQSVADRLTPRPVRPESCRI
ncbi:MAG: serine/threonine protein kinase [Planctomyces sp.]|nr:serine/threonine protein kinase [Planctomyces sp.]